MDYLSPPPEGTSGASSRVFVRENGHRKWPGGAPPAMRAAATRALPRDPFAERASTKIRAPAGTRRARPLDVPMQVESTTSAHDLKPTGKRAIASGEGADG